MSAHWPHHFWLTIPPLLPVLFLLPGILSPSFHNQGVTNELNLYSSEWISNNISGGKEATRQSQANTKRMGFGMTPGLPFFISKLHS